MKKAYKWDSSFYFQSVRRHQLSLLFLFIVYLFALSNSSGKGGERPLLPTISAQGNNLYFTW